MKKKLLITLGCSLTEGVGCYDPITIPEDMTNIYVHKNATEVYNTNRERFHEFSWSSLLRSKLKYDSLINLGLGASSTSGNLKVWFEKYFDKNLSDEFDVLVIWLLPEPNRISFYRDSTLKNIIPYSRLYSFNKLEYNLGREYIKFLKDTELDALMEQVFYLKIFGEHCKFKNYKFLFTSQYSFRNRFFETLYKTESMMTFEGSVLPDYKTNHHMKSLVCDHPNERGYQYICNQIFNWIETNKPEYISQDEPKEVTTIWDGFPLSNHIDQIKPLI